MSDTVTEHAWRVDQWARVQIAYVSNDRLSIRVRGGDHDRYGYWVGLDALHPLPPLLTPEALALLDAEVEVWRNINAPLSLACFKATDARTKALEAYMSSITPPQPPDPLKAVKVAKEALEKLAYKGPWDDRAMIASDALSIIAALEAGAKEGR